MFLYSNEESDDVIGGSTITVQHCSNISGDILDSVFSCFSGTIYDIITFLIGIIQKREYLRKEKRCSKKENAILYFKKPFK